VGEIAFRPERSDHFKTNFRIMKGGLPKLIVQNLASYLLTRLESQTNYDAPKLHK
jgi:hypothetical protein